MPVKLECTNTQFVRCVKIWILVLTVGTPVAKKFKRHYVGAYGGVWRSLCLAGVRSQAVGFC
jgi:hypothetical protein